MSQARIYVSPVEGRVIPDISRGGVPLTTSRYVPATSYFIGAIQNGDLEVDEDPNPPILDDNPAGGLFYFCANAGEDTIPKGTIVEVVGAGGGFVAVLPAAADGLQTGILGMLDADLPPMTVGRAIVWGEVKGLDTSELSAPAMAVLSNEVPGTVLSNEPDGTKTVFLGVVVSSDEDNGIIRMMGPKVDASVPRLPLVDFGQVDPGTVVAIYGDAESFGVGPAGAQGGLLEYPIGVRGALNGQVQQFGEVIEVRTTTANAAKSPVYLCNPDLDETALGHGGDLKGVVAFSQPQKPGARIHQIGITCSGNSAPDPGQTVLTQIVFMPMFLGLAE